MSFFYPDMLPQVQEDPHNQQKLPDTQPVYDRSRFIFGLGKRRGRFMVQKWPRFEPDMFLDLFGSSNYAKRTEERGLMIV